MEKTSIVYESSKEMNKYTRKLLYSKYIIAFVISFITLVTIFSFIPFFFRGTEINDKSLSDWQENGRAWIIYSWFGIALLSSIVGILGDVFIHRNNKLCFVFYFIFISVYFLNGIILHLWYDTIQQFLILGIVIVACKNWGKESKNTLAPIRKQKHFYLFITLIVLLVLTFIFGMLMSMWLGKTTFADPKPYIDAFTTLTFIGAWILMTRKYLSAYLLYFLCTIATLIIYIELNAWIYVATNIIYIGLYIIGFSNWIQIYYEQNSLLTKTTKNI